MAHRRTRHPRADEKNRDLPAPYSRLLTLGFQPSEADHVAIANALRSGETAAAVQRLIGMALDETFYAYDEDDPRQWAPLHAVAVLRQLGPAAREAIEPLLPLLAAEDGDLIEELEYFYAEMGKAALPTLHAILDDGDADTLQRVHALNCLAAIGEKDPDVRDEIALFLECLVSDPEQEMILVSYAALGLTELSAVNALPSVLQAFRDGRIDEFLLELADVQEHFGLPITEPRRVFTPDLWEESADAEAGQTAPDEGSRSGEPPQEPYVAEQKVGRNEPCPCGSGKKYKKCCGG